MQTDQVLALRLAASEQYGDDYFDDPGVQQNLLFKKSGDVIFDALGGLDLAYHYPTTVGSALFFHRDFEAGEIAFATAVLRQSPSPVVIDAGANIGLHMVSWCAAIPTLRGYAFEPVARNVELLETNLRHHGLEGRVTVIPAALGEREGTEIFSETDDAAYSSIRDTQRRPIVSRYEVPVTTVDAYVERNRLASVDLIKIDVEGYEDEVLRGARTTIERYAPHLFVEISAKNQNADPEQTIVELIANGYRAFVINEGIITEYDRHDDRFYNYFFVHARRDVTVPSTDVSHARAVIARYEDLIARQRFALTRYDREIDEKEAEIRRMKAAAEERLELIRRLETVAKDAGAFAQHESENAHAEVLRLGQLAEGRLRIVETLRAEIAALTSRYNDMEAQQQAQNGLVQNLQRALADKEAVIQDLKQTATERLGVIERFQAHVEYLRSHSGTHTESGDNVAAIGQLQNVLQERERQLAELRQALDAATTDAASKDLLIAKLDHFLSAQRGEVEEMRKIAEERLQLIQQLDALANERLEVIRGLNKRFNED